MDTSEFDINDVMKYFYEISSIPRMSGKEKKIADYVENFAQKRNLKYIRDIYNNIIIIKDATKDKQNSQSIILQSHLDMVCEKEENSNHDFEKDGLDIYIDGDYIKAKDTTLGADNGIGVAIILAILNSNKISHPKIEAIFTVQEETTMEGAKKINVSMLESKKMICLDNMNEEELWIGCAGAKIFEYEIEECKQKNNIKDSPLTKIEISGFRGGHSGKDISKNRGNPIKEMGNLLKILSQKYDICLKNIYGGRKVNVIPRECYSEIYIRNKDLDKIKKEIINYKKALNEKINDNENIIVDIKTINQNDDYAFDTNATKKIIKIIEEIKNGVYYKDNYDNPLVSLNIGKIENNNNKIKISFSIRSNRRKVEEKLEEELNEIVQEYKIKVKKSELEGYEHKEKSMFIEKCKMIYKQYFSIKPKVIDMHICLEAGFFRRQDTRPRFYCNST